MDYQEYTDGERVFTYQRQEDGRYAVVVRPYRGDAQWSVFGDRRFKCAEAAEIFLYRSSILNSWEGFVPQLLEPDRS